MVITLVLVNIRRKTLEVTQHVHEKASAQDIFYLDIFLQTAYASRKKSHNDTKVTPKLCETHLLQTLRLKISSLKQIQF